jgi:hypothetical protein
MDRQQGGMAMAFREISAILRCSAAFVAVMSIPLASAGVRAQAVEERDVAFDIAAGSLQSALVAFGSKTGWQLIYAPSAVAGWRVGRLQGHFSPRTALEKLIGKTDCTFGKSAQNRRDRSLARLRRADRSRNAAARHSRECGSRYSLG